MPAENSPATRTLPDKFFGNEYTVPLVMGGESVLIITCPQGKNEVRINRPTNPHSITVTFTRRFSDTESAQFSTRMTPGQIANLFWEQCPSRGRIPKPMLVCSPSGGRKYSVPLPREAHAALESMFSFAAMN